ncbi:hypothetical protein HPP92_011376 [Vanilla planifolia]|uniref:Uncharacterized protein n=1 Tax=Vanilla planifolia TaxID=51239 RepID=A0A835R127_VANPL|nr:hypothetical protein HPP92_011669 [Vanilla planifolia]KAG0483292.1 hypothetical protein HPP92_011376 [Vanilla planifolia]
MGSNSGAIGEEGKHQFPSPRSLRRTWSSSTAACAQASPTPPKCVCAPATHAGSFKCRLHRVNSHGHSAPAAALPPQPAVSAPPSTRTVEAL